jgi:beta-lactam-binding protein with PASTA domain
VVVIGVVIWVVLNAGVKLPDFTQKEWNQAKAEDFLKKNDLTYTLELQQDPNPGSGKEILSQVPEPDTKVKKGEKVSLKIAGVKVPTLTGVSFSSALQNISSQGLAFDTDKDLKFSTVSQADQHEKVLGQDPQPGKLVAKNSDIKLTVGRLANKRFDIKGVAELKTMKGIKMSPMFITREVQPESQ